MVWELVLTIMLNGEPREIDWMPPKQEQSCREKADWLNGKEGISSYHGAKAFCRQIPPGKAHPTPLR